MIASVKSTLVSLLCLLLTCCGDGKSADNGLKFSQIIDEASVTDENRGRYDREPIPNQYGIQERYIERMPSFSLSIQEIDSIVVEKRRVIGPNSEGLRESIDEFFGLQSKQSGKEENWPHGHVLWLSFNLEKDAAKTLNAFFHKNVDKVFAVNFMSHWLTSLIADNSFDFEAHSGFSTFVRGAREEELKKLLAPIEHKVTWK